MIPFQDLHIVDVANFQAYFHKEGYQLRSLNAYRSSISSVHDTVDGIEVEKHLAISRLLRGAFHSIPPLLRYKSNWDVQVILHEIDQMRASSSLPLEVADL